jgi:glycosyltransferase involved in cell wall biosynthesis
MKIAVIGTRGIPATFGGIEKHCEELYSQLAEIGNEVVIYCRKGYVSDLMFEYKGIKLVPLNTINSKSWDATFHTFWALCHAIVSDADLIHFHAQGPCIFSWMPKIFAPNKKMVFTCHGIDWQRNKWNFLASSVIKLGEIFSARFFHCHIGVSSTLEKYYKNQYNLNMITIYNGTAINDYISLNTMKKKYGLSKGEYFLFVGRLVPEKAPHRLIKAFKEIDTAKNLVIAGGSSMTNDYEEYLKNLAKDDSRIIFTSYVYGEDLQELYSNAFAYISASELEGLPLTLLEAMSYKLPCLVSNIAPHVEVIGENNRYGYLFDLDNPDDLRFKLIDLLTKNENDLNDIRNNAFDIIQRKYNWKNAAYKVQKAYNLAILS